MTPAPLEIDALRENALTEKESLLLTEALAFYFHHLEEKAAQNEERGRAERATMYRNNAVKLEPLDNKVSELSATVLALLERLERAEQNWRQVTTTLHRSERHAGHVNSCTHVPCVLLRAEPSL